MRIVSASIVCALLWAGCGRVGYEPVAMDADGGLDTSLVSPDGAPLDGSDLDGGDGGDGDGGEDAGRVTSLPPLAPTVVVAGSFLALDVSIVWDGAAFAIVYQTPETGEIMWLRVDHGGRPLTSSMPVSDGTVGRLVDVAYEGGGYGVAWKVAGAARFRRVASDGSTIGPIYTASAMGVNVPIPIAVGTSPSHFAILFATEFASAHTLNYSVVDRATGAVAQESVPLGGMSGADPPRWNGTTWMTVTRSDDADQLWLQTFDGDWVSKARLDTSADQTNFGWIAETSGGYAVLWHDVVGIDRVLHFQALDADGSLVGTPVVVTTTPDSSTRIVAVKRTARGTEVWLSRRTFYDRYLLDDAGTIIDSVVMDEPTSDLLTFDRQGPDFTFIYVNAMGLWMQRVSAL